MKKILALTLTSLIALGGTGIVVSATTAGNTAPLSGTEAVEAAQNNLYLVPGTYISNGVKVENTLPSGAQKLSKEQCEEIFTDNAYICTLSTGEALPTPASTRKDKEGNAYSFNGWWSIVDATVTYFDKVPTLSETTYLYADWRADLSQRMDPVEPDPEVVVEPNHYMEITHTDGTKDKITLRQSSTDVSSALHLGYGHPVQLSTQFTLNPGDIIKIYTTGLNDSEKPDVAPLLGAGNSSEIQLESNGTGTNRTADYLLADEGSKRREPSLTYIAEQTGTYNIYIKFFGDGSTMAVYMEPPAN